MHCLVDAANAPLANNDAFDVWPLFSHSIMAKTRTRWTGFPSIHIKSSAYLLFPQHWLIMRWLKFKCGMAVWCAAHVDSFLLVHCISSSFLRDDRTCTWTAKSKSTSAVTKEQPQLEPSTWSLNTLSKFYTMSHFAFGLLQIFEYQIVCWCMCERDCEHFYVLCFIGLTSAWKFPTKKMPI